MTAELDHRAVEAQPLGSRRRALEVASRSLFEFLERDERCRSLLEDTGELPDRAGYVAAFGEAAASGGIAELRLEKRRRLLEIAGRDLAGEISLETVGAALADLADACLQVALEVVEAPPGLAVIGMGKLGARELNYVSDIDVMFVTNSDLGVASKAAERSITALTEYAPEGRAYEIDTNLRPEGRSGALVRSLEGYLEYYRRWAQPWEYQALIKARPVAGARQVGEELVEETRALVFSDHVSAERIASVRAMKERVEGHAARSTRRAKSSEANDVKLGPGGIRDIEFSVQLLQLVHGGADPSVRPPDTLTALEALVDGGYVADEDGAGLAVAYRWLRSVEHRLQLQQERRVHRLPPDPDKRAQLARSLGFKDTPLAGAATRFERAHQSVLADVRLRFEKLFYRPMVESLADTPGARLSGEAVKERLRVLGFRDVDRASRTLQVLVSGTSRRAKLLRVLTPAMLRFLALAPLPDEGLLSFLRLGEALSDRVDALGALRDNPPALALLARVLGSGRLLGEVLMHVPEELQSIADPEGPGELKAPGRVVREAIASLEWREPEQRLDGLRRFKRREMLRIALLDLSSGVDTAAVGSALADLADACLGAALGDPQGFCVIGMGKLGGRELNYSSDIDVMFVHDGDQSEAESRAEELVRAIGEVTPEGQAFRIDLGLRPEGKSGPLVRSLSSYAEYYERWARPWEHLALLKARVVAGAPELGERLLELTRPLAYPKGVDAAALAEIRHLKARMEKERVGRGVDPRRHIKMGPGGLADIEFAVQLIQFARAFELEELRTTNTLFAIDAAERSELLSDEQAERLRDAYVFLMRLRNRLFFAWGRPIDVIPPRPEDVEALGIAMGFEDQPRQEVEEHYLRVTRRARKVAEPLIYG